MAQSLDPLWFDPVWDSRGLTSHKPTPSVHFQKKTNYQNLIQFIDAKKNEKASSKSVS